MAREFGIRTSVLYRWRDEYGNRSKAALTVEQENARLRPQVRVFEMEREILQKAAPFFATLLQAKPNTPWVTEITYIPTREGWLYLAAILDVHSRKVVGGLRSERIDTRLVLDAFSMANQGRKPPQSLIHHSNSRLAPAPSIGNTWSKQTSLAA